MDQKLIKKLSKRESEGTLRSLSHFEEFIDFYSNDYLGLAKLDDNFKSHSHGSTGSRLISGNTSRITEAEKCLAIYFSAEAGLMFNSGYDANIGFFSTIPQRGDTILYDELIHASVRDGVRLGFADSISFKHNDLEDLRSKLSKISTIVYVAVEALYSMDGDIPDLKGIAKICKEFNAYLIVDEAHSSGVFGKGLVAENNLENDVFARLITFGKAYGSHGGLILGSHKLISFLQNFARSFIYTTALPEEVYLRNENVTRHSELQERRKRLHAIISYFRTNYAVEELISDRQSPIQIVQFSDIKETRKIAERLYSKGIAVKPIYSPTVQKGKERIRLCFHEFNTVKEVDLLIETLKS